MAREKLMALLWPEVDDERARRNLAQAVYALRQELGDDALQGGTWDLRLNGVLIGSDIAEFEQAGKSGALEQAAALYDGPFLDGFAAAGSSEFDRWAETRRSEITHEYASLLDQLAAQAEARRDAGAAVAWLRKRAAGDTHDGKVAARLIRALARAGDPGAARAHATSFQAGLAEALGLPPDAEVEAAVQAIDRIEVLPATTPAAPAATPAPGVTRRRRFLLPGVMIAFLVLGLLLWGSRRFLRPPARVETVSIGRLADYRPLPREELIGPLGDLLATSLARSPSVRVVSTARMYELLSRSDTTRQKASSAWAEVARLAGATQVVEGALYPLPDGRLMLDLRRVDLKSGEVLGAARAQAGEPFALVDSATAVLLASFGAEVPSGSIKARTTSSLAAYRLYEQGLRAWFRYDVRQAERLFMAALTEDSTFAMAAYYAGRASGWQDMLSRIRLAERLATRVTERERLLICAGSAMLLSDPRLGACADSLVTRFPEEVEGYFYAATARNSDGDFLGAMLYFERVVAMDSIARFPSGADCRACNALAGIYSSFVAADSLPAAERTVRRWTRLLPQSALGWYYTAELMSIAGRPDEAMAAARVFDSLSPASSFARLVHGQNLIRQGRADTAAAYLEQEARLSSGQARAEALWFRVIALREAGRGAEAIEGARRYRREVGALATSATRPSSTHPASLLEGVALESVGRFREAAAVYDSIARWQFPDDFPSSTARRTAWSLTHVASALAAAGDTMRLARLADSVRAIGARSGFGRDRLLHWHIRGLLHTARGQDSLALDAFRAAIYSTTFGYSRTNVEMARLMLKRGQPGEAIAVLEPALRGSLEGSNLYAPRYQIHALLARAYGEVGNTSKAEEHRKLSR